MSSATPHPQHPQHPLLAAISSPADLRKLPAQELGQVATELRQYLIETVSQMGGHFAGLHMLIGQQLSNWLQLALFDPLMYYAEEEEREDGVLVTETFDAESENSPEMQKQGWQAILDSFRRHVEAKA